MAFEQILAETREHSVPLLTLNEPSTLNALTPETREGLVGELDRLSEDPALRCVAIRTEDHREGVQAILARREPRFVSR